MPYLDQGQSPSKTLGRPNGRVKASAYHPAYHRRIWPLSEPKSSLGELPAAAETSGGSVVSRPGVDSPELGRGPRSQGDTTASYMVGWMEAFSRDFAWIAATGEYGPMRGVIRAGSPLIAAISS